jgi:hypothetical protein
MTTKPQQAVVEYQVGKILIVFNQEAFLSRHKAKSISQFEHKLL